MNMGRVVKRLALVERPPADLDVSVPLIGVTCDSRKVTRGVVFVAVRGELADGHRFATDAVRRGAAALVVERRLDDVGDVPQFVVRDTRRALAALSDAFHGYPSRRLHVMACTGTNGKTTICHLVRGILEEAGLRTGVIGTLGCDTTVRTVATLNTTPDSTETQSFLEEMLREGCRCAIMEVSSHALCQRRVVFFRFAAAGFSNFSRDHLDYHGTMDAYRDAKARLFSSLGPAAVAVLNGEDPASAYFASRTSARLCGYGVEGKKNHLPEPLEVSARLREVGLDGAVFELITPEGSAEVRTQLVGRHNILNALAAAALARTAGAGIDAIARGLGNADVVDGRLHPVRCGQPYAVSIDYAHTAHALETVLKAVRPHVKKRIILVFGAGGDRDRGKRPKMARAAERFADVVWLTSDNPRSEDPDEIIRQVLAGAERPAEFRIESDREQAIFGALREAEPGDMVLIAGKGHERVQIFRDGAIPFDDREVAQRFLLGEGGYGKATA